MSGSEFSQIRRRSQAGTRITSLVRAFQTYVSTQFALDKPDFRSVNRPALSRLKYHDKHVFTASHAVNSLFYCPFEPDGDIVVGHWKLDHNGRGTDSSGFAHHMAAIGNPRLKKGIDIAGLGGSLYAVFDDDNRFFINDRPKLNSTSYRAGFSIAVRIYPFDISDSDAGGGVLYRHIVSKHDDTIGTNGYAMAVSPAGEVIFTIWHSGTALSVITPASTVVVNTTTDPITSYDIVVTVTMDGRGVPTSAKIYVNNTGYTTTTTTNHLGLVQGDTNKALRVGALFPYNSTIQKPYYKWHGGIQDLRIYREKILSDAEVSSLYTNKLTIRDIPFGQVALAGVGVWTEQVSLTGGFSPVGFSPVGFHIAGA